MKTQKQKSKKIEGCIEVEPKNRVEFMVRDAIERAGYLDVHGVDVRINNDREELTTLAHGRCHVYGYEPVERKFKRYEGNFKLVGFRSSHTPLGLDPLHVSFELDTEIYPGSGS